MSWCHIFRPKIRFCRASIYFLLRITLDKDFTTLKQKVAMLWSLSESFFWQNFCDFLWFKYFRISCWKSPDIHRLPRNRYYGERKGSHCLFSYISILISNTSLSGSFSLWLNALTNVAMKEWCAYKSDGIGYVSSNVQNYTNLILLYALTIWGTVWIAYVKCANGLLLQTLPWWLPCVNLINPSMLMTLPDSMIVGDFPSRDKVFVEISPTLIGLWSWVTRKEERWFWNEMKVPSEDSPSWFFFSFAIAPKKLIWTRQDF